MTSGDSNGIIFNDLDLPGNWISRSSYVSGVRPAQTLELSG